MVSKAESVLVICSGREVFRLKSNIQQKEEQYSSKRKPPLARRFLNRF